MESKKFSIAAELLTNLLGEIYKRDNAIRSQVQARFGKMVLERFRLVLRKFENGEWVLDSECPWEVRLSCTHIDSLQDEFRQWRKEIRGLGIIVADAKESRENDWGHREYEGFLLFP